MREQNVYLKNQTLVEAKATWLKALENIGFNGKAASETIPVDNALGKITASPVFAALSSPSYNAAAMDGVAVDFSKLSHANEANPVRIKKPDFQPVNTGNAIPGQYNAVVMIEDVHYVNDDEIELHQPATPWQHIRTIGEDIVATELIIPEHHTVRPIDQGAMLAAGVTKLQVLVPPTAVVIPTGSELVQPGQAANPGNIIEFNSRILSGYLREWGATATRALPVKDDKQCLLEAIRQAVKENDIVITNAGASAGTKDFTSTVFGELGEVIVHGVAIKPGKPVVLAIIDNTPVIGLPGYPVSALLTMRLFLQEMIYNFMGLPLPEPQKVKAMMSRPLHSPMGVDQYVRVTLGKVGQNLMATPSGKGAGAVMSMVRADAILTIPSGSEGLGSGEEVEVELVRPQAEVESTLVVIGSHDNILDLLANQLHRNRPIVRISSAHVGSMGGIMAIRRNEAHFAGTHLLDEETGEYNVSFIQRYLSGTKLQLINLCYRQQGLIVQKGNPKEIKNFIDIAEQKHTFINRQGGAGTRLLTDKILKDNQIATSEILGYEHEEYTHMSVAAAVANGSVDCGMGIRAAAQALDLDFLPIAEERYDIIIPTEYINDSKINAVLELIRTNKGFHEKIIGLGGYDLRDCGEIMYEQ